MQVPFTCNESELQFAGALCTPEEPCPVYLELSTVAINGGKLFAGGNLHTESATLGSILLLSDDAGATWKEPTPRIEGSAFDQIQFLDSRHGWIAGETQNPLPRDPFVMITTDGGASWHQQKIAEDGTPGAIVRVSFDSPEHGMAIVDAGRAAEGGRYQLYESETGGTSWTLRSKTDQMPKQSAAHDSADARIDVRIRAAKDGKTIAIERRVGNDWQAEASMLIEAARCGFEPGQLKEPGPDSPAK